MKEKWIKRVRSARAIIFVTHDQSKTMLADRCIGMIDGLIVKNINKREK